MIRHEHWREQYRVRRYMEYLKTVDLEQRAKDVFQNLLVLTEEAKIGLPPINGNGHYWMSTWTHVLEEFSLRYGPYPAGFTNGFMKTARIPSPMSTLAEKAARAVKQKRLEPGSYLVKYGPERFLREVLECGTIQICPADFYNDSSLNPAINDNELEISVEVLPSEITMTVIDKATQQPKGTVQPISNVVITSQSATNYYVYCLSTALEPRLFLDFDADACLVITKPKLFIEKLFRAFDEVFSGWDGFATPIIYVDPLRPGTREPDLFRSKHFRYVYQKEFRVIWLPPQAAKKLDRIYLQCSDLAECCELIQLEQV